MIGFHKRKLYKGMLVMPYLNLNKWKATSLLIIFIATWFQTVAAEPKMDHSSHTTSDGGTYGSMMYMTDHKMSHGSTEPPGAPLRTRLDIKNLI
jgi:hypothetical protein